ncbi:hypothetical protein [Actinomycetospora endophytica]|nr:hypothetical protein [Actinomycetospora endophytica]
MEPTCTTAPPTRHPLGDEAGAVGAGEVGRDEGLVVAGLLDRG